MSVPLPPWLAEPVVAREGFIKVRCPLCDGIVHAPMGPDHWHPATSGYVLSRHGLRCGCGVTFWRVTLDMLANAGSLLEGLLP